MDDATAPESRYEYRCWFRPADAPDDPFPGLAAGEEDREARRDTYLLPPGRPELMPKLRDEDRFEVKERLSRDADGIERWTVRTSAPFPLDAGALAVAERLFGPVAGGDAGAFRAAVERAGTALVIETRKRRRRFIADGLMAEVTRVDIPAHGLEVVTVAAESARRERLAALLAAGPLAGTPNLCYGAFLEPLAATGRPPAAG